MARESELDCPSLHLEGPERRGYGGGEVQIGPGNEEVAQSRRDEDCIHNCIQ